MATSYLTPGVYVEEVDRGTKPIEGVGTAVAAFLGVAERGQLPFSDRDGRLPARPAAEGRAIARSGH